MHNHYAPEYDPSASVLVRPALALLCQHLVRDNLEPGELCSAKGC